VARKQLQKRGRYSKITLKLNVSSIERFTKQFQHKRAAWSWSLLLETMAADAMAAVCSLHIAGSPENRAA
jgi:hypothetical protein